MRWRNWKSDACRFGAFMGLETLRLAFPFLFGVMLQGSMTFMQLDDLVNLVTIL